ncbi:MAG: RICIN domain-containing protein [Verrucomicrobiota bacterium]
MRHCYLVLAVGLLIGKVACKLEAGVITVLGDDQQTIEEWGCFVAHAKNRSWSVNTHSLVDAPNATQLMIKDMGMTMHRVDAPYCWYYDKNNPSVPKANAYEVIEHINLCVDSGVSDYIMTVWSPPVEFKTLPTSRGKTYYDTVTGQPVNWFQGINNDPRYTIRTVSLKENKEAAFTKWISDFLKYIESNNAPLPKIVSFQNEPAHDPMYYGCFYQRDQYERVLKALRTRLDNNGFGSIKILGGDANHIPGMNQVFGAGYWSVDSGLKDDLQILASHSYDIWASETDIVNRHADALVWINRVKNNAGIPIWMTEWSIDKQYNSEGWSDIYHVSYEMRHMIRDLVLIPYEAYFFWLGYDKKQKDRISIISGPDDDLLVSKKYHVLKKLWNQCPPGSIVRHCSSTDSSLKANNNSFIDMISFHDSNSQTLMVVNHTNTSKSTTFKGIIRGSTAHIYQTTDSADMEKVTDKAISGGEFTYSLRPNSVTIFICGTEKDVSQSYSGDYKVISKYNNRAVEVKSWSTSNGGNIEMRDYQGNGNQKWTITSVGGDDYKIINKHSGKGAYVDGGSNSNGANINQRTYEGWNSQKWRFQDAGGGYVYIVNKKSGKGMSIEDWFYGNGGNVEQQLVGSQNIKKWLISNP